MQKKILGLLIVTLFKSAYAETKIVVDEVSSTAPKAKMVESSEPTKVEIENVSSDNLNTVNLDDSIKLDPNVLPDKVAAEEVAPEVVKEEPKLEKVEPLKEVKIEPVFATKEELTSIEVALPVKKSRPVVIAYEEKPMSQSEKIRAYRQKMEERYLVMLQKKIEEVRLRQEMVLAKKLSDSVSQTIKAIDEIK